ncbi:MAG: VCBS repeat-containing protein [Nanoarchaeota archaeon]|nr:VCBS repeat-containing protein [Nanoarchaeota archaeon]
MKKRLLFVILILSILIISGCEEEPRTSPDYNKQDDTKFYLEDGQTIFSRSPIDESRIMGEVGDFSISKINERIEKKGSLWIATENKFAGKSEEELKNLLGLEPDWEEIETKREEAENYKGQRYNLPDYFDWRDQHGENYVTPIKDQEQCGSCWAFATMASQEGNVKAYFNNPNLNLNLSEQDLVSCFHGSGCGGLCTCEFPNLLDYLINPKICTEVCFPYTATNEDCANKCSNWQDDSWGITSWQEIPFVRDEIKNALITKGPLITGMEVYDDFFSYEGGIYSHVSDWLVGYHAVTIVGYGQNDGLGYWIVKNSWGEDWGEDGYFRILIGDSGIDSLLIYNMGQPNPTIPEQVICNDIDNDGYCNWGIGNKPTGCPSCNNLIEDCDDSDPNIFEDCGILEIEIGTLEIFSAPYEAKVFVKDIETENYNYRGETPLIINLNTGEREIKITKEHYEDYYANVNITENESIFMHANLLEATELLFPLNYEVFGDGNIIEIIGTAPGHSGFQSYIIEYGVGESPNEWFTSGINLANDGTQPIINSMLGFWGTSSITETDYYTIKLTVFRDGAQVEDSVIIYLDSTIKGGWPVDLTEYRGEKTAYGYSPVIANVDGGDDLEVIVYGVHHVFIFKEDGTLLEGWPQKVGCYSGSSGPTIPPSMGDIDGDGENEIVAPRYSWWGAIDDEGMSCEYCVYAWNLDGTPVSGWPIRCDDYPLDELVDLSFGTVVLSDLTGDSKKEIIVNYNGEYTIYDPVTLVFKGEGLPLENWPFVYEDQNGFSPIFADGSPAVGDVDCDGEDEIVTLIEGDYLGDRKLFLYVLSKDAEIEVWEDMGYTSTDDHHPVLIDLDNDCDLEVIFEKSYHSIKVVHHTGDPYGSGWGEYGIYWSEQLGGQLSARKLEEDNFQIIFGDVQGFFDGDLSVYDNNASLVWQRNLNGSIWVEPILVDINNDGLTEIFTTSFSGNVFGFDSGGNTLEDFPKRFSDYSQSGVAVGDIDNDGKSELVAADWFTKIYVWDLVGNEGYIEWPMFQHDAQHTGLYSSPQQAPPCENSTQTTCGETFSPDCIALSQTVCCGDDLEESYLDRDCADSSIFADSCYDQEEDNACCDDEKDCVMEGVCHTRNRETDYDPEGMWTWTNNAGTTGHYKCLNVPGMIYDCDHDPDVCQNLDWACNVDETKPYGRAAGWAFEGENHVFGGYGDSWGRGIGVWGAYDQGPSSVINNEFEECCGDDQGEYLISGNGFTRCCNNPNDKIDANGNCIPKVKPIKKIAMPLFSLEQEKNIFILIMDFIKKAFGNLF